MQLRVTKAGDPLGTWGITALFFALVTACYWPALAGEFVWNDSEYVTVPALRSWSGLGRIWGELGATEQYYPLLHSAFWVQHRLWGDHSLGYHLATIFMHAGAAVLFAFVLKRLAVPGAWLAALIFGLHPVHVESVAWITEQKNTLSLVFYLGAALTYLRFDETRRYREYAVALIIFILSLLCKTVTATLPAALLVVLWWKKGTLTWRQEIKPLVPWLAIGLAAGLFSSWVERRYVGAQGASFELSGFERVLVAGRAIWFYLGHLLWPLDLNFIYPRWQLDVTDITQWFFPVSAFAMTAILWIIRQRTRAPLAAWLLLVGALFPVLGFVNLYGARYSFVWDHWQYLPDLGPIALAAAGLTLMHGWFGPRFRMAGSTVIVALVAALGLASRGHSKIFHDNETLYRQTLARNPSCWLAYNNLAVLLASVPSRVPEAIEQYEQALRVKPDYAEAHMNLAGELVKLPGELPAALRHYEQALQINPNYAEAHYNLANVLAVSPGRGLEALAHYQQALQLKPDFAQAHVNLANELAKLPGRVSEALAHYEQALHFKPDLPEAHHNYAVELAKLPGRASDAVFHYEQALRLEPDLAETHLNLADLLATMPGRGGEAINHYESALTLRPDLIEADINLGNLLAKLPGRQPESLAHYEHALRLNPNLAKVHYDLAIQYSNLPGHEAEALLNYQEALRLKPNYPAAHNNLAILYARQGRLEDARKHWEEALRLNPDFDDARRNLDLLQRLERR